MGTYQMILFIDSFDMYFIYSQHKNRQNSFMPFILEAMVTGGEHEGILECSIS